MCNGVRAAPPSASACAGLTQPRLKAVARQITSVGIDVQWLSVIWRHAACGEIKPVTRKGADKSLNHDLSVLHHPSPDPTGTVLHDFPAGASEHGHGRGGAARARGERCLRDDGRRTRDRILFQRRASSQTRSREIILVSVLRDNRACIPTSSPCVRPCFLSFAFICTSQIHNAEGQLFSRHSL